MRADLERDPRDLIGLTEIDDKIGVQVSPENTRLSVPFAPFRRHLVGTAALRYTRADFKGVDLVEQDLTTSLGVEYFARREVALFARYAHVDFETTTPAGDYTADEFRIGMRLRR